MTTLCRAVDITVFFMIIKSKYLYLNTALNIYKKDFTCAIDGFESFNDDFIKIHRIYKAIMNVRTRNEARGTFLN